MAAAFDHFVTAIPAGQPIVLAGHSQGAFHLRRLLVERIAGTPVADRIAVAYVVGWPVSIERDLPLMGLPACAEPSQAGCIASWQSWAEPAGFGRLFSHANARGWLDGSREEGRPWLCSNPLSGMTGRDGVAEANRGTLLTEGEGGAMRLQPAKVPARCSADGVLLIGEPPEIGRLVMPGNNYHVYDIPLFWANLRSDVRRRVEAWHSSR